jgi:hypothetical protein
VSPSPGCDSPYNITVQAWQVEACTYVIKYTINGRPGISDFGFRCAYLNVVVILKMEGGKLTLCGR